MHFMVQERLYLCVRPIRCRCRIIHTSQDYDLQNQLQIISETRRAVLRISVCQIMPSFSRRTPVRHGGLKSFRERCAYTSFKSTCDETGTSKDGTRRSLLPPLLTSRDCLRCNSDDSIRLSESRIHVTEARGRMITSATLSYRTASHRHHAVRPMMRFSQA